MKFTHSWFFRLALLLGLLSSTFLPASGTVVRNQQRSREELLKEAGRLATEAERTRGEMIKNNRDSKSRIEAEKAAAENFEKAIELWREAGDDKRLVGAVEELTRIYSVVGDYERVVDRLTSEAEYWRQRGNAGEQVNAIYSLGIRQLQMRREAAAIETLERVVAMSPSTGWRWLEPNALSQLAGLYERVGRIKEAEAARERAKQLWSVPDSAPARTPEPAPRETIPAQWVDLPGAPAAAEYREVDGVNQAVLVNRSSKGIELVMFGCVALEDNKKARVLYGLIGQGLNHGGVRPGSYYRPFAALNGPLNGWTDEKMGCEGAAKMALIEAQFADGTTWKADGIDWVP